MSENILAFWMTLAGTVCWGVCFWWMRRISIKQNFLLDQLREQGRRIEKLSKIEHDLIKEVHPQVNEIKEGMEEIHHRRRQRRCHHRNHLHHRPHRHPGILAGRRG